MNDNRDSLTGFQIHSRADFLINKELFDFYSFLPDFRTIDVREHRYARGHGRRLSIQTTDRELFIRMTVYRFSAS